MDREKHADFDLLAAKFAASDIVMRTTYVKPSLFEAIFSRIKLNGIMKFVDR